MKDKTLIDFADGRLSDKEVKEVLDWIELSEGNRLRYINIKNLLALTNLTGVKQIPKDQLKKKSKEIVGSNIYSILINISRYAAVILLAAGVTAIFFHRKDIAKEKEMISLIQAVTSPPGQTTELVFSDGSVAILNSETTIKFPACFGHDNREIWLDGEGYFNVVSNPDIPFIVNARDVRVIATGTSFNVEAYESDEELSVTLIEGTLMLKNKSDLIITKLFPNQNIRIKPLDNSYTRTNVDTHFFTSWQKGFITFSNTSLDEIARKLERWYNVNIIFEDKMHREIRYSGTILKNKPLSQVLEILKLTSHFNYEIEPKVAEKDLITIKK